jgi:hypothetical protein
VFSFAGAYPRLPAGRHDESYAAVAGDIRRFNAIGESVAHQQRSAADVNPLVDLLARPGTV